MNPASLINAVRGQSCWHISAGGATAPSFVLVMGEKVSRNRPLRNAAQPELFRKFRGSIELLVWSCWRLQDSTSVLATSDQGEEGLPALRSLIGVVIEDIICAPPAWDLLIRFRDGRELATFSDHLQPNASVSENWELWVQGNYVVAGPGSMLALQTKVDGAPIF